jgi:hypothetical protein
MKCVVGFKVGFWVVGFKDGFADVGLTVGIGVGCNSTMHCDHSIKDMRRLNIYSSYRLHHYQAVERLLWGCKVMLIHSS